jgi:DNA-binding transcriptional ArsR family regulator
MPAAPRQLDRTLLALADPTRRAILERLTHGETRVTKVAEPFAMSLNAVSKHIRTLERARLVKRRRAGREHFLSLDPAPLNAAVAWIEATRAFWTARLDALDTLLEAEDQAARRSRRPRTRATLGTRRKAR